MKKTELFIISIDSRGIQDGDIALDRTIGDYSPLFNGIKPSDEYSFEPPHHIWKRNGEWRYTTVGAYIAQGCSRTKETAKKRWQRADDLCINSLNENRDNSK